MKTREDKVWNSLLAQSAPTFAGNDTPPYGLATRVLAAAREAQTQTALWERIGLRAIFASCAAVIVMSAVTFARVPPHDELDVPLHGLAPLEDVVS